MGRGQEAVHTRHTATEFGSSAGRDFQGQKNRGVSYQVVIKAIDTLVSDPKDRMHIAIITTDSLVFHRLKIGGSHND